jgi:putative endonuclease
MYYVYILKLVNNQFYIGYTFNLKKRLQKHLNNAVKTTKRLKVKDLIFYAAFINKKKALDFEKYLKTSSGFAFRNKRLI